MSKALHNRGRIEITAEIIRLCEEARRKTVIMYGANLSFEQLKRYLKELEEDQFIEKVVIEGSLFYKATRKGKHFLAAYDELLQLVKFNNAQSIH